MKRAVCLFVSLLALLWAVPTHAGHIIGVKNFTVSPDTAKVGDKIKVTLKGYVNLKNYKCTLSASTTEGSVAAPAEIGSPNDASISVGTPYNFDVSFDVTFQKPHSPADISVKLAQGTLEGQPLDNCDGISPSSQVWVMAADGKGKITGLSFSSPKVKVGDAVDFTVAGTGGLCNLNFQFVGGSWNGDTSGLETSLPFKSAKASFTKDGSAELTVTSLPSQTCDAGEVKAMVTVEKIAAPLAKKPDLMCSVAAYKDEARTQAIASGDSVAVSAPSPKVYVVVTLQNVGDADVVPDFESRVQYKFNNQVVGNPGFAITGPVSVGQTPRTVSVREVAVPGGTTTMEVTGSVDSKTQIDEKDEANNQCKLTITTKLGSIARAQGTSSAVQIRGSARAVAPKVTMGMSSVKVHQNSNPPKTYSKSFDPAKQNAMVEVGYYTLLGGNTKLTVIYKNIGPGNSKPMTAGGSVAGGNRSLGLDPRTVPAMAPGETHELQWDAGLFQQAALTVILNLK